MWVLIAVAAFPVTIAIIFFVLARLNIWNPLYSGIDLEPDTRRCPYCHKAQDRIAPGICTCPQCHADLIIKDDLVLRFLPKDNQNVDLSTLKPVVYISILALLPIYYFGTGIAYGIRNVMIFLSPFSFYMARLGLRSGVVGARFGQVYRAETPKLFYLTIFIWYAASVTFAYFLIRDISTR